jgi:hypothetical protein
MEFQIGDIIMWYQEYSNGPSYGIVAEILNETHCRIMWFDNTLGDNVDYHHTYLRKARF